MNLYNIFKNYINSMIGRNQEFEQLLAAGDISTAKSKMGNHLPAIAQALKEYKVDTHEINNRPSKVITDKKGNIVKVEDVWKLPIPYQPYINEIALVFLYGRPPKWTHVSKGTDNAFKKYQDVIKNTHFNSKLRQCKRLAGAETQSAMLFRTFRNDEGKADVQIRVLASSKGDEIYTRWDQYENLIAFAWGYYVTEEQDKRVYHFDIYTSDTVYHCSKKSLGWDVVKEINFVGKIPVILFEQEKEWEGVESLIYREEFIGSRSADTNDYFSDPIAIMNADIIKNLPEKQSAGKLLLTNEKDGVDKAAKYLTWDSAPESKQKELEWLQEHILSKTFTPKITLDSLKSISQLSAKALKTVMMLADIKASKHKETHDELLDRTASLIKSIIGNVLEVSLKSECENLIVEHEFQEPFGEDVADCIIQISQAIDSGILSTQTGIELNPLIKDSHREAERIEEEKKERQEQQQSIFVNGGGMGPLSFSDGNDEDVDDENRGNGKLKGNK